MRIQHNIKALNAHRTLRTNNSREKKNVEKLASGYRINRAADDAAGLNISEQMRAQVTGLDQARANSLDGVSLVETMEGAMEEVHGMLNRMMELAIQSGNDTYTDQNRQTMQEEIDALADEFERIEQTTKFNGISLLQGSSGAKSLTFQIAENTEASSQLTVELADLRQVDVRGISVATADQARESVSKIERGDQKSVV